MILIGWSVKFRIVLEMFTTAGFNKNFFQWVSQALNVDYTAEWENSQISGIPSGESFNACQKFRESYANQEISRKQTSKSKPRSINLFPLHAHADSYSSLKVRPHWLISQLANTLQRRVGLGVVFFYFGMTETVITWGSELEETSG